MFRYRSISLLALAAAGLLAAGCGPITPVGVARHAAMWAGKQVVKKAYKEYKERKEAERSSRRDPSRGKTSRPDRSRASRAAGGEQAGPMEQ